MNTIGLHLRDLRTKQNLSLKDVYRSTGISDSILSRIETGTNTEPSPVILKTLSALYDADLVTLYLTAGYLDTSSLSAYKQVFRGVELLSEEEKQLLQNEIDLFTKNAKDGKR